MDKEDSAAVCRSIFKLPPWQPSTGEEESSAAASVGKSGWSICPSPSKEVPWLVIPYGKSGTPRKQAFYNIMCDDPNDINTFRKSIPELIGTSYIQKPSHQGWLIILCDDDEHDYSPEDHSYGDCFLWNPSTLQTIPLPSLLEWSGGDSTPYYLVDCVLSSAPPSVGDSDNSHSMVLFVYSAGGPEGNCELLFLYCLPGDKKWRKKRWYSETILVQDMQSLHYFKDEFYLMCAGDQNLVPNLVISTIWDDEGCIFLEFKPIEVSDMGSFPLVAGQVAFSFVATSEELYCIPFTYSPRGYGKEVAQIAVMRLDFDAMAWKVVYSIGNRVLFLGSNLTTSACCSAADMGLDRGCLYFALSEDQCLYKFDIETTANSFVGLCSKVPKPWKDPGFIMMPKTGKKGSESIIMPDEQKRKTKRMRSGEREDEEEKKAGLPQEVNPTTSTLVSHLPWLMSCKVENFTTFNFVNPIDNSISYQYVLYDLEQTVVRFQKGGWLLVSMENPDFSLFFYNPFTKAIIKLPELPVQYAFSSISFSSLPTSPDCIVFAIKEDMHGQVRIYFIKKGEAFWSSCPFANTDADKYIPPLNTPVFYNGDFYSVDYNGSLAVFKVDGNSISWKVLEKPHKPFDSIYPSFLVECDRELLLVKMGRLGMLFGIFRLDSSRMDWIKIENLGKFMLFVSHNSCFSVVAPPNSSMENKVYFPRLCMNGEGVLFYCLQTGRYRSFGSRYSASDFSDTQGWYLNCTWIQQNNSPTDQELDWVKCPSSRTSFD